MDGGLATRRVWCDVGTNHDLLAEGAHRLDGNGRRADVDARKLTGLERRAERLDSPDVSDCRGNRRDRHSAARYGRDHDLASDGGVQLSRRSKASATRHVDHRRDVQLDATDQRFQMTGVSRAPAWNRPCSGALSDTRVTRACASPSCWQASTGSSSTRSFLSMRRARTSRYDSRHDVRLSDNRRERTDFGQKLVAHVQFLDEESRSRVSEVRARRCVLGRGVSDA